MTWWPTMSPITIWVYVFLLVIAVINAPRIFAWLASQQDAIERYGRALRRFKYQRLVPWIDRLPLSADALTWSRLLLVGTSLLFFRLEVFTPWVVPLFVVGWTTDYLDGLKAHAEALRRGRETLHGRYLDPAIDMTCFGLMVFALGEYYPDRVMIWFIGAIATRLLLFGLLLLQQRHLTSWRQRLSVSILPKSITGEVKAAIIAVSFGLIISDPTGPTGLAWASRLLVLAIIFEAVTLIHLTRTAIRRPRLAVIDLPRKTGND